MALGAPLDHIVMYQPGDVGFSSNHDFTGSCIRWAQARKYGRGSQEARFNHTFMIINVRGDLIEAQSSGVVQRNMSEYPAASADFEVYRPPYVLGGGQIAADAMTEALGEQYGFMIIASEAIVFLTATRMRFGRHGTAICSGKVSYALTRANIDVGDDMTYNSPADVTHYRIGQHWTLVQGHSYGALLR